MSVDKFGIESADGQYVDPTPGNITGKVYFSISRKLLTETDNNEKVAELVAEDIKKRAKRMLLDGLPKGV